MKAILVDDDRLALEYLKHLLERDVDGVEIIGMYSDPRQVLESIMQHKPDVIFLDIHMPEINGLILGEQIQMIVPDVQIVFVTGYDQYAVQAFELYALDYIMKPIQLNRLQLTVQRIQQKFGKAKKTVSKIETPLICLLDQIKFQLPGEEAQCIKWRTSKAQELFTYLVHHRDQEIAKSSLTELLWSDFDEARASQQLYTTIYHIRQTLKTNGLDMIVINNINLGGGYRLTLGGARLDTEEWEEQVKQLGSLNQNNIDKGEQVLKQYRGDYLGINDYIWAEHERERLRQIWLHLANGISRYYIQREDMIKAIQINLQIQKFSPYEEESYFTLMKLYDEIGNRRGVEEQYKLLVLRMVRELDSTLSHYITYWYEQWKQHNL